MTLVYITPLKISSLISVDDEMFQSLIILGMTKFSVTVYHALDYLLRKFVYMKSLDEQAN